MRSSNFKILDSSRTRVSEQTSEKKKKTERLEQHQRRYIARSGNKTPQERESRLLNLDQKIQTLHLHSITQNI